MLNKIEERGCQELLSDLQPEEIISLAETVTKKQVKLTTTAEALKAILTYSESPAELLKRKKVKRDALFRYLALKEKPVSPNADKKKLILTILRLWGSKIDDEDLDLTVYNEGPDDVRVGSPESRDSGTQCGINRCTASTSTSGEVSNGGNQSVIRDNYNQSVVCRNIGHDNRSNHLNNNQHQNVLAESDINARYGATDPELQTLGEKFTSWFYENLNTHNPVLQKPSQEFGPQHFWDDCYFMLSMETQDSELEQQKFAGPFIVSQRFLAFSREELLLFSPNISKDGIFVKSDPHGLVMILACGTVHRNNECLGTFQQQFGIVKDPRFENNWKIKMTVMKVKTTKVTAIPKLESNPEYQLRALSAP